MDIQEKELENFSSKVEELFKNIKLQNNQEKIIFGFCSIVDKDSLKVVTDVFISGSKISISEVVKSLEKEEMAEDFNSIIEFIKTNQK